MATAYSLAQVQGTASVGSYATLTSTSASQTAVVSSISVCNTTASAQTFRIGVMATEGSPAAGNWIVYGANVPASDTVFLTVGLTLGNTKYVRVSSSNSGVDFSASVAVIT